MDLIKQAYWWRGLWGDVVAYMWSYPVYQHTKTNNRKKDDVLQPIPIPKRAWQKITMDLVTDLLESEGKTAIAVFVDQLIQMTQLVPCTKEVTVTQYARLFVDNVFWLHIKPEVIILDCDNRFVTKIWMELFSVMGTGL